MISAPQNSTLVLTADKSARITDEPSGEPETLWGKINPKTFGDRVQFSKPSDDDGAKKKRAPLHGRRLGVPCSGDFICHPMRKKQPCIFYFQPLTWIIAQARAKAGRGRGGSATQKGAF